MSILRPYPFKTLGGGLDQHLDKTMIDDQHVASAQDISFHLHKLTKRLGLQVEGTGAIAGTIQNRFDYFTTAGVQNIMALSSSGLYTKNISSVWTLVQSLAAGAISVAPSYLNFNGTLIITNSGDPLYQWTGTGAATQLTGSPPQTARALLGYQNKVLALGVTLAGKFYPYRIMWCVTPDTRVLCADLIWRKAGDVPVGEEVVSYDAQKKVYARGLVTASAQLRAQCYEVKASGQTVTASADHKWLVRSRGWVPTKRLRKGDYVHLVVAPWKSRDLFAEGWISGFIDGEGTQFHDKQNQVKICVDQNLGPAQERFDQCLSDTGLHPTVCDYTSRSGKRVRRWIFHNLSEQLTLVGLTRPMRFLRRSSELWEGKRLAKRHGSWVPIASVKDVGERDVVALKTTTRTLVTEGIVTHNSDFNNANNWASGDAGLVDLLDSSDIPQAMALFGPYGVVLRRNSLMLIQPAASPFFYSFTPIVQGSGVIAQGSVQTTSAGVLYLGDGMLYNFNAVSAIPIGLPAIATLESVNYAALGTIQSGVNQNLNEYYLALPINGAASPNILLVYNYLEGYFTQYNLALTAVGTELVSIDTTFNQLTGGFNTYQIPWDAGVLSAGSPSFVGGQVSTPVIQGTSYDDQGVAIAASVTTKLSDLNQPGIKYVSRVQVIFQREASGVFQLIVGTSDDGNTVASSATYTFAMNGSTSTFIEVDDLPSAGWFQFTVQNNQNDIPLQGLSIVPYFTMRGSY